MRNKIKTVVCIFSFSLSLNNFALAQSEAEIADFAKAAKFNDVSTVRSLVSKGVSPNSIDAKGE